MTIPNLILNVELKKDIDIRELPQIQNSQDAFNLFRKQFNPATILWKEEVLMLCLNNDRRVIGYHKLSLGGMSNVAIDVRTIFTVALKALAVGIVLAHNHPSGNCYPSKEDIDVTTKITQAGKILDIYLLDHLILSMDHYYSFKDHLLI